MSLKLLDCCKKFFFSKVIVCLPIMILGLNPLKIKLKNERFNPSFLTFNFQLSSNHLWRNLHGRLRLELEQRINHIPANIGHHVQKQLITFSFVLD